MLANWEQNPTFDFLNQQFLGNAIVAYVMAIIIVLASVLISQFVRFVVQRSLQRWSRRHQTELDRLPVRILGSTITQLGSLGGAYLALANLRLHPILQSTIRTLGVMLVTVIGIRLIQRLIEYGIRVYCLRNIKANLGQTVEALFPILRIVIWSLGLVFLLDNLGFDISAMIASLGVAGVAIALASQGVLQDLLSYFSILLDRPFQLGDFILVGDYLGTIKHIGIKTTRLESLSGEEIIIANTDLMSSRVRNYKRMEKRRVTFTLGVIYETPAEKLAQIPNLIAAIIEGTEHTIFDRAHFVSYGDFSLNYEVVYYVDTSDYNLFMDQQQAINLSIFQRFADAGIEFAYPTQVHYLQPSPECAIAPTQRHEYFAAKVSE